MRKEWETRDILLFLILIILGLNILFNLSLKKLEAETFKLDDCITAQPTDKPAAYLHVVTH
jgi:hypothetical protein